MGSLQRDYIIYLPNGTVWKVKRCAVSNYARIAGINKDKPRPVFPNLPMAGTIVVKKSTGQKIHRLYETLETIHLYPSKGSREAIDILQNRQPMCNAEKCIFILLGNLKQSHLFSLCSLAELQLHNDTIPLFKILPWLVIVTIINVLSSQCYGHLWTTLSCISNFISWLSYNFNCIWTIWCFWVYQHSLLTPPFPLLMLISSPKILLPSYISRTWKFRSILPSAASSYICM